MNEEYDKPSYVELCMDVNDEFSTLESEETSIESEDSLEEVVVADTSLPNLLVVEDNKDLCNMLRLQLEDSYNVYTACDGADGLKKIHLYHPDIVVTDQMMPNMDGLNMLKHIRSDFQISHIPVIILTAKGNDEAKTKAISMGANAYIIKPFSKDYLMARVEQLLSERKLFQERVWKTDSQEVDAACENAQYEQFLVKKDVPFIEKIHDVIESNLQNSDFNNDTIDTTTGRMTMDFF